MWLILQTVLNLYWKRADQSCARCTWNGGDGFDEDY